MSYGKGLVAFLLRFPALSAVVLLRVAGRELPGVASTVSEAAPESRSPLHVGMFGLCRWAHRYIWLESLHFDGLW